MSSYVLDQHRDHVVESLVGLEDPGDHGLASAAVAELGASLFGLDQSLGRDHGHDQLSKSCACSS